MNTKTTGYVLLGIGIFIMIFSVVLVILAFINIIHPTYFSVSPKSTNPTTTPNIDLNSLNSTGQPNLSALMPSFPPGVLDNALNLSAHFFLMTFIGGFGHKLAMIGVNLIRPIIVKTGDKIYAAQENNQSAQPQSTANTESQ